MIFYHFPSHGSVRVGIPSSGIPRSSSVDPSYPCCAHDLAEGDDHGQATASVPPLGERCGFMEVHGCDQP